MNGLTRVGIVRDAMIHDIQGATKKSRFTLSENLTIDRILSEGLLPSLQQVTDDIIRDTPGIPVESARLLSPILNPEKILLMAVNYHSHSKEWSKNPRAPTEPYMFTKFRNALVGPGEPVLIPRISRKADWEVELAVIIGRTGKNIPKNEAMNYVAGYAVSNDISYRDLQLSTRLADGNTRLGLNWVKGKGLDSSFPLGPWLVTSDKVPNPHDLQISLTVNGKTRQQSNTSDMIFKIDSIIEYASAGMTLRPGDVISTGTPEGVAEFTGGPYLMDGDIIEGTVERIGTLRKPVKAE